MALILSGDTGVPASGMPTGSVIQTVSAVYSVETASTSGTLASTGLTASITPISASNKILIIVGMQAFVNGAGGVNGVGRFAIYRNNATNLVSEYVRTYNYGSINGIFQNNPCNMTYLDSPATTSSTSYTIWIARITGDNSGINADGGSSTITLLEIKQ